MLYECNVRYVPLSKEIKYLENYIMLQQFRLEDRAKVSFSVSGDTNSHKVAPSILITFLENCFTHGFDSQVNNIEIIIGIEIDEGILKFKSRNNRVVVSDDENPYSGIGLQNVREATGHPIHEQLQIDY